MTANLKQQSRLPFKLQNINFSQALKPPNATPKQTISRQQAISNIISYSQKNNNLIQHYNQEFFVTYFDCQTIQDLAKLMPQNVQIKKDQFVKKLATFINHNEDQTLFLIISLNNMYKRIKDETKSQNGIKFSDFTSHICQKISNLGAQLLIPLKQIPGQKAKPDPMKVRSIDLEPPVIISEVQKQIPQISKEKKKKDKKVDPTKPLAQFFLSPSASLIMTLGSLSSAINIYSLEFEKKKQIFPSCVKNLDKKLAILSFAFSQKQQRIGAIINNIGVAFWDFSDNFRTEKLIERTNIGSKIYYLELNDEWVTANQNSIFYWDLKNESQKNVIKQEKSKNINDISEITHIRAIGVAYTMKDDSKWVIIYQPQKRQRTSWNGRRDLNRNEEDLVQIQFKRLARVNLSPSGCHTLYYNRFTQVIIPLGYKDSIPLYSIDSQSLDISLLHEMKGHQTIVTAISQIDESDIIFTGDDKGYVIVWTLSDMRCQQVIRVANWINSLRCIGNRLYYGDARINVVTLEGIKIKLQNKGNKYLSRSEPFYGIFKTYRTQRNEILIFTRKACRIISMLNGKTLKIIELCDQEEQILVVQNYFNGYIIGTSKGDISHYTVDFQQKWRLPFAHQSDTSELKIDRNNKFFLSKGRDSNIYIWAQKTLLDEGPRKILKNGQDDIKQEISFTQLSQKFGVFITCSYSNEVRIWDYESCRLVYVIEISQQKNVYPVAIKICDFKPLLYVAVSNESLLIFQFIRKQSVLEVKMIGKIDKKIIKLNKNERIQKKKPTLQLVRGMSMIAQFQDFNLSQDNKQNRYACSSTLKQIEKDPDVHTQTGIEFQKEGGQEQKQACFLVEQILIDMTRNDYKLILAYNKGSLIQINLNSIIQQNFSSYNQEKFKKSANVQRPIKQSLIRQIYKSQVGRMIFDKKKYSQAFNLDDKYVTWNIKLHKDLINHIDVFQTEYISTLCVDGYYKLINLATGNTMCSLNINFPLPIKWDYRPHKNQEFCEKIQQALLLLDQIFSNSDQLTKKQFEALNVRPFLENVCRPSVRANKHKICFSNLTDKPSAEKENIRTEGLERLLKNGLAQIRKKRQQQTNSFKNKKNMYSYKIEVLSDEYAPQDLKRAPLHYPSLKSHEVYKRVKQFINIRGSQNQFSQANKSLDSNRKKAQIEERQSILQLFSPNYLPKLLNKDLVDILSSKLVLGQRNQLKAPITLTKDDFRKVYNHKKKNSFSVPRQKTVESSDKIESVNKINLEKLTDENPDKKMHSTGFQLKFKKFGCSQSSTVSLNRSEAQSICMSNSSSFKINKTLMMKQICLKTQQFKKMHKIVKI